MTQFMHQLDKRYETSVHSLIMQVTQPVELFAACLWSTKLVKLQKMASVAVRSFRVRDYPSQVGALQWKTGRISICRSLQRRWNKFFFSWYVYQII